MSNKMLKRLLLVLTLLLVALCGTAFALMFRQTASLDNQFTPAAVSCVVEEKDFEYPTKSSITVTNTGNIDAYIRIRLVTYWKDSSGKIVFGPATIPAFTPGTNWIVGADNTYYYALPVNPNGITGNLLTESITMAQDEKTGYYQVIEVFADAIQSKPEAAVTESWGVTLTDGKITGVPN